LYHLKIKILIVGSRHGNIGLLEVSIQKGFQLLLVGNWLGFKIPFLDWYWEEVKTS